jgi:hypothetical protein
MFIELTDEEILQCENFAKQVFEAKKGTYGEKFLEMFSLGIKGEMVYGKIFGLKVNFSIYEGKKGDGGTDFQDINVKTVSSQFNKQPWLKVDSFQHKRYKGKIKKYALVTHIEKNKFEYLGSIDYNKFEQIKKSITFNKQSNNVVYYVSADNLDYNKGFNII